MLNNQDKMENLNIKIKKYLWKNSSQKKLDLNNQNGPVFIIMENFSYEHKC